MIFYKTLYRGGYNLQSVNQNIFTGMDFNLKNILKLGNQWTVIVVNNIMEDRRKARVIEKLTIGNQIAQRKKNKK